MTVEDVRRILSEACRKAGSQVAWAQAHGVSAPYVNDVLRGNREPGNKILDALELDKVVTYRKKPNR